MSLDDVVVAGDGVRRGSGAGHGTGVIDRSLTLHQGLSGCGDAGSPNAAAGGPGTGEQAPVLEVAAGVVDVPFGAPFPHQYAAQSPGRDRCEPDRERANVQI